MRHCTIKKILLCFSQTLNIITSCLSEQAVAFWKKQGFVKLCTVDQLEPNATIVVYYEVLQHDQLESNITKSVQSRTSNFHSSVKKKELERSYIWSLFSVYTKIWERRTRELEAYKILSSRDRSDVNRYQLVLMQCQNRLFCRWRQQTTSMDYVWMALGKNMSNSTKRKRIESKLFLS